MNTPPSLDQTALRIWPDRRAESGPLIIAGLLILGGYGFIIWGEPTLNAFDFLGIVWLIIGVWGAVKQLSRFIDRRPRYILSRQGILIVHQRGRQVSWDDIERIEFQTTPLKDFKFLSYVWLHLHRPSYIPDPKWNNFFHRLFSKDEYIVSLSLDEITMTPGEAFDHIQRYHRQYSRPKRK